MKNSHPSFRNTVVVITGASSGIGRATARAFALQGADLVLAARRERVLRAVAAECEKLGVRALAVPTDVTRADEMENLAQRAIGAFGSIDVWINNAGVGLFGPFAGADVKAHQRVVETNLFGTMNGTAAVLPHFLRQRAGILITNISVGGLAPVPFASAYTASKFGMRGFLASLRQEVAHVPGIHVCGVFPAFIDTPGYQHGGNVSGSALRPARPLLPAEAVAQSMVELAFHPRDEVTVGWTARAAKMSYALAPSLTEKAAGAVLRRYLKQAAPARPTHGNLFLPVSAGTGTSGGWKQERRPFPSPGQVAIVGLLALGAAFLLSRRLRPRTSRGRREALDPFTLNTPGAARAAFRAGQVNPRDLPTGAPLQAR